MLPALERLLVGSMRAAVILEYAESLAPAGDPTFQADADRAAIITLHRWSSLPAIEKGDNIILLIAENLSDLAPKIVSNPKVAVVDVPMPDRDDAQGRGAHRRPAADASKDADRYAEVTAGLKAVQIASILTPPPAVGGRGRRSARRSSPASSARAPTSPARAKKLAALTAGMAPRRHPPAHRPGRVGGRGRRGRRRRSRARRTWTA